jgi:hypothetical protein
MARAIVRCGVSWISAQEELVHEAERSVEAIAGMFQLWPDGVRVVSVDGGGLVWRVEHGEDMVVGGHFGTQVFEGICCHGAEVDQHGIRLPPHHFNFGCGAAN